MTTTTKTTRDETMTASEKEKDKRARRMMAVHLWGDRRTFMRYGWNYVTYERGVLAGLCIGYYASNKTFAQVKRITDINYKHDRTKMRIR